MKTRLPWSADRAFGVRALLATGSMARALLPAALLWVSACSQGQDMNARTDASAEQGEPLRKLNPAPKRGYAITMTMKDAPGPFASIGAVAQYTVDNSAECGKKIHTAGVFPRITTNEPFVMARVSDNQYRGVVYADLVLDEDYFGRGVCKWEFVEARVRLQATNDEKDTRFVTDMVAESVFSERENTRYFWKERYPRVESYDAYPELGEANLDSVPPARRREFFVITLGAERSEP